MLESLGDGKGGCGGELGGVLCSIAPTENLSNGLQVVLLESGFGDEDKGSSAVRQRRGISRSDGAILGLERGAESAGLGFVELEGMSDESQRIDWFDVRSKDHSAY